MSRNPRAPKAKKAIPLCAYCGKSPGVTEDHVLPVTLFPKPRPKDSKLIIVPACDACNKELSKYQDFLRDWLVTDFRCSSHPAARQLLEGPIKRSVGYGKSKLARAAQQQGRLEPFLTSGGIYVGHAYTVPFNGEWINYVFSMMARGLYFSRFGKLLPDDYIVTVAGTDPNDPLALHKLWEGIKEIGFNGPCVFGDSVCMCFWNVDANDPAQSIWILIFYEGIGIELRTLAPSAEGDGNTVRAYTARS
jgi:hypothetical protein